jgi:hypothetical protein
MAGEDDIPGTRWALEYVTVKYRVYALLALTLLGAGVFIAGLVQSVTTGPKALDGISEPALMMAVGMTDFALFCPLYMALYFARHFLVIVKRLERENAELRAKIAVICQAISKQSSDGEASPP